MSAPPIAEAELKKKVLRVEQVSAPALVDLTAYSTWIKLLRVTAWILRFCRSRVEKRYVCLLIFLHMRAVHLEVTLSLNTDSCIMALRRFKNPVRILSDNGMNFVGAERKLREALAEFDQEQIEDKLSALKVQWSFNPPAAPWFGGGWKSLIKSTKREMKVMLGNVLTVDETFLTVVAEVESLLNSHPLVYGGSSTSPSDVSALTPHHFLHGRASVNASPCDFVQSIPGRSVLTSLETRICASPY